MESLDFQTIRALDSFAQQYPFFDTLFRTSDGHLFRTVPIVALAWWAWFAPSKKTETNRERVVATLLVCFVAIVVAKLLSISLPFRARPLAIPGLVSRFPNGSALALEAMSSFPSDHAVLFFSLSVGLAAVSLPVGVYSIVHTIVLVCLPRIYLGMHYPTDIVAGAFIGSGMGWAGSTRTVSSILAKLPMRLLRANPGVFYALLFVMTFLIGTVGADVRRIVEGLLRLLAGRN